MLRIPPKTRIRIEKLARDGWDNTSISRELAVSIPTVAKYAKPIRSRDRARLDLLTNPPMLRLLAALAEQCYTVRCPGCSKPFLALRTVPVAVCPKCRSQVSTSPE
jgi:hypothetical protein